MLRSNNRRQVSGTKATDGQEAKWRDMLRHHRGWVIVEQASDGNCLFRSVAHQGMYTVCWLLLSFFCFCFYMQLHMCVIVRLLS